MQMLLQPQFLNGPFGDPALFIFESKGRDAILVDCGDLSRLSTKQLLKVNVILLSHCHMDHFFDFDLFLRVHMKTEKSVTLFGPPDTALRVAGKLQAYTWNLLGDLNLEFKVVELDASQNKKCPTLFRAKDQFKPTVLEQEAWAPGEAILDSGVFHIQTAVLDHRTPSLAYAIEERMTLQMNERAMTALGLQPGPWINELKKEFLFPLDQKETVQISVLLQTGETVKMNAHELIQKILSPRPRHKVGYATDGAAHAENKKQLLHLFEGADVLFHETCFLESDRKLADETKHFTAKFVGELATEAGVKKLVPFHFSKRYLKDPEKVYQEIQSTYSGELVKLEASPRLARL